MLYVHATVALSGIPSDVFDSTGHATDTFLQILNNAISLTTQSKTSNGYVAVTIFSIQQVGSRRRAAVSINVDFRVEANSAFVPDQSALLAAAGNANSLAANIQSVGSSLTSDNYSGAGVTVTSEPAVVSNSNNGGSSASTSGSSTSTTMIIGIVVGIVGGVLLISAVIIFVAAKPRGDADIYVDPKEAEASTLMGEVVELAEVKSVASTLHTRQASFYSSIRLADDADESQT